MLETPVTDALVAWIIAILTVMDTVLGSVVDLGVDEPLTGLGSANASALAEIAIAVVDYVANLVETILISIQVAD
jgi:hypothetical protein